MVPESEGEEGGLSAPSSWTGGTPASGLLPLIFGKVPRVALPSQVQLEAQAQAQAQASKLAPAPAVRWGRGRGGGQLSGLQVASCPFTTTPCSICTN